MVQTILYVESFSEQILYFSIQVYLVTGGYFLSGDSQTMKFRDSTEILIKDAIGWNVINVLPQPMAMIGGISFQNKIFMIGIRDDTTYVL